MKNICSTRATAASFSCDCVPGNLKRIEIPEKYIALFNQQGFVDVPQKELMPGNKYATDQLVRFVNTGAAIFWGNGKEEVIIRNKEVAVSDKHNPANNPERKEQDELIR